MPGRTLKDISLFENTEQLQNATAALPIEKFKVGYRKMLASAQRMYDEAKLMESEGDEERAYVYYMRAANAFQASRKAKDYDDKRDRKHWQEMGGKNMLQALQKAEPLFHSLKRRYELKKELEVADQAESCMRSATIQRPGSAASQESADGRDGGTGGAVDTETEKNRPGEPPKRAITPFDLYDELRKNEPSVLILDTRDRNAYNMSHINSPNCINVPLNELTSYFTASLIEKELPIADRTVFRKRHNFDYIVLVDAQSEDEEKVFVPGHPLRVLTAAICEFGNERVLRHPLLLIGGYDGWYIRYPSLCTNPTSYEPPNFGFNSDGSLLHDKYDSESWSYPDFESLLNQSLEPLEKATIASVSIPVIPDRASKPILTKPFFNGSDVMDDMGDYIQLRIPEPWKDQTSNIITSDEDTQKRFDKAVSAHIDLRDRLDSIGEKFRSVHEEKEHPKDLPVVSTAPIPDRTKKPSEDQTRTQVTPRDMEEKMQSVKINDDGGSPNPEDDGNAAGRAPVPNRSSKPNFNMADRPRTPVSPNTPTTNRKKPENTRKDNNEGKKKTPPPTPRAQVPDRSTKPATPRDVDTNRLQQVEYEFFCRSLVGIQGIEGRVVPGLTGLKNLGNSCYMNSTVQCLSNIPPLSNYFLSGRYRKEINYLNPLGSKGEVARNYAVLLGGLWEGRMKYVFSYQFKQCIGKVAPVFAGYDQQDSQEFLVFLLDGLHEDLNLVKERRPIPEQNNDGLKDDDAAHRAWINHTRLNSSVIVDLFQGQYLSVVRCRVCQRESRTFDVFMYLSLPIPSDRKCKLEDCLQKFSAPEDMTGDCKWFCPHCQRKRDAVKKICIWKLPKVLLIHLKRFSCNGRWREKLQTSVDFPTNRLDMSEYCRSQMPYYTLMGVSNHYGTMESGHYTAYCRNAQDSRWYKFDDHDVSPMSQGNVKSPAAYILYYISEDHIGDL